MSGRRQKWIAQRVIEARRLPPQAEAARERANARISRIEQGIDRIGQLPSEGIVVAELAERYMKWQIAGHSKAKTIELYRAMIDNHIVPTLGRRAIGSVKHVDVAALHYKLRDRPGSANATVRVLSQMFHKAQQWDLLPPGRNPCRFVRKFPLRTRNRYLTREECKRLGDVLREGEADGSLAQPAVAALRLLLLTGCRRDEILTLQWDDVDLDARELRLRDSKTGPCMVALTAAVETVLDGIPRIPGNPWVIVGERSGRRLMTLKSTWRRVTQRAELGDLRLHDLRHSYASRALAVGESLSMIGKLLNHVRVETTARYAHLILDAEKAAAARVGDKIRSHIGAPVGIR